MRATAVEILVEIQLVLDLAFGHVVVVAVVEDFDLEVDHAAAFEDCAIGFETFAVVAVATVAAIAVSAVQITVEIVGGFAATVVGSGVVSYDEDFAVVVGLAVAIDFDQKVKLASFVDFGFVTVEAALFD